MGTVVKAYRLERKTAAGEWEIVRTFFATPQQVARSRKSLASRKSFVRIVERKR